MQSYDDNPPPNDFLVPLVHKIQNLYKNIYRLGTKIPKRDKLGIHSLFETICLTLMILAIESTFTRGVAKKPMLEKLRVKTEIAKQLLRTEYELSIITDTLYLDYVSQLVEISKMTTGWIQSLPQKPEKEQNGSFS
ncbi:MAG: hypothetical protein A2836_01700 [Candidatus Taylorbacteria bacterium RIFCSPHIGHO2_01_FULL_45_63]|uniref:Four helix bundle protein n=1 Tax=Candidatus Taylorbacteria bacterium RIFCSPHIGHO2_02_FULL_45_35 TaxID=1802311 RepID=A0A1G2MUP3_9BACT|nr:MAG: hypothetical protein A2836_01700 [Candidatus Taylorbacteria bacterium RIFCSPHIGHO2_01_FULL_45_63]OHA26671.1 MAG: hypothetical protein A3D56_02605 [Candidatus Taylorbacteria bacterium RIFCSPHIGHO2_02_FULL_45_35]